MYQVTFFSKPTKTGGYQCASANCYMFYLAALIDAFIKWIFNRTVKCIVIHDQNTGETKLVLKR